MRVLELSQSASGEFAALLLAELGAEVIKVEHPRGDPRRSTRDDVADDLSFDYLNRRKRGVTLDPRTKSGRQLFLRLVATADAVVEDLGPGGLAALRLSYRGFKKAKPDIVLTSISAFGLDGPWSDWRATEIVLQATGGVMAATGYDDTPPQKLPGRVAHHIAGLNAAIATLTAVYGVHSGLERGVQIDISAQETFAPHWARHISQYAYTGLGSRRPGRQTGLQGFPHTVMAQDGYLYLLALRAEWEPLAFFLGLEQFITSEWSDPRVRAERWSEIDPDFRAAIAARSKYQWFTAAAERGYTFAPLDDALALAQSPQLLARGFFQQAETGAAERVPCPGLPFPFAEPPRFENRPPGLAEHNQEVYAQIGLGAVELARLRSRGVI